MISSLTRQNYTVLFISHKLNEVKEICNRVTVLRQGKSEGTHDVSKCSIEELAKLMVGREVKLSVRRRISHQETVVLDIQNLSLSRNDPNAPKLLDNICIQVKKGEVVGIAGVDGNGQSELVECLTGLRKIDSGTILFDGKDISNKSTRQIMSNGVSHIPEDRTHTGLILSMNLIENMILQDYYRTTFGTSLFINWKYARHYTEELIKNFNIKTPGIFELVKNLSGGNQQAVIAAREITRNPKLLIAMHPTRGLDIGRIEFIHDLLMRQRDAGMAILLVSTELDEIRQLSDRILPIYEGKITGDLLADEASVEQLGLMMGGAC